MKIAYIFSMKNGIAPFIYSELLELEKNKIKFAIFPTKYRKGLAMPKKDWEVFRLNPLMILLTQPLVFAKQPGTYLNLFFESLFSGTLMHFLIAGSYSLKMRNIDRIHCHFGDAKLFIGYYCKKLTGKKLSVTIHAHELYQAQESMFRKSLAYCDNIITISDYNKNYLIKEHNVDSGKITVNRLFVDTEKFRRTEKTRILIVAQWHEKKGHRFLFEAVKKLNRQDIELWIVGGMVPGYAELDVEKLAKDIGVFDICSFFGELKGSALKSVYNAADIFVLPSYTTDKGDREGIPVSLMEAMAYGLPVISTYHTGIPELVEETLVKEKNASELAKAIEQLIRKKKDWGRIGKNNRKIILAKYAPKNLKNLARIFRE
ncbi:MAG: group 1 glycosyl transferase [archaeon GW2011_AR3]|nr:MAG: group 1 glycosyl transferase [archaeon GW2011_AR3]MBS3109982.1 glycosyltransferase family 4 protein [Candidatus Woesearchaeota archaeon]